MTRAKTIVRVSRMVRVEVHDREMALALSQWAIDNNVPYGPYGGSGLTKWTFFWDAIHAKKIDRWLKEYGTGQDSG